ncbi:alpha/beta hydrolase fold domain-containing protein, partial [Clavibacter michiganensis]
GIDAGRIAVGGASAGGGIAAATVLLAHDRGTPAPAFQLLVYPMLDDRTVTRTDLDTSNARMWSPGSNRVGWTAYLGGAPGGDDVSPYAAPARREDLSGLPPAWVGVGTLDLFHDEDVRYAERLRAAGSEVELEVVDGAFHGFDTVLPAREVSRRFWRAQAAALRGALLPGA